MENQLVVFCLANELYGVSIAAVSEIIMLQPITYVPRAPAFVEGVTNLRGKVLPVIDLRKRFGLIQQEYTKETRIIVAEVNRTPVGMIVDAVSQVLRVAAGAIEPPSPVVTTVDSAFIRGIAKVGSRLVILLDLEQVLLPGEQAELQQVVVQQAGAVVPAAAAPTVESAVEVASGSPRLLPRPNRPWRGSRHRTARFRRGRGRERAGGR
jgi:purine-binding chemotaxis protein CheW